MRRNIVKIWLLVVVMVGIAFAAFAVTDEINRIAEQADKMYVQGRYNDAFPLMKRAAEGGDVISMFTLGTMYYEGQGTAKNETEARRWWQEAANHGDSLAKEMLKRLDTKQVATVSSREEREQGAYDCIVAESAQSVAAIHEGLDKKKQIEEQNAKANVATKTYTANGVSFTMVEVEGGTFTMGATGQDVNPYDDGLPAHQVTLSDFCIGQTEVTQALWQAVMGSNPSKFTGEDQRPVDQVNWHDCQKFIKKLNKITGEHFRLPTEAEWEYAARGGNLSQGYIYSGSNTLGDVAWYGENGGLHTHTVATKSPNELGLYDMSGNVYEWCQDCYGSYKNKPQTNPKGSSSSNRVYRGGDWGGSELNCRVFRRGNNGPSYTISYLGLRLAL